MNTMMKRNNGFPVMGSLLDDFFSKDLFDWNANNFSQAGTTLPSVNVRADADAFHIELAAPGMSKEDFRIELDKQVLTITGKRKEAHAEDPAQHRYTRREFSYQSFSRSFRLPSEVVENDRIEARYEAGILQITLPKKETAKPQPPKTIAVQ